MKQLLLIFFLLLFYGCGDKSITSSTSTENTVISNSYNKIEWQKMDADQDGSISPKEMKDHYQEKGIYN